MAKNTGLEECLTVGLDVFLDAQPGKNNSPRFPGRIRGGGVEKYILLGVNRGARAPSTRRGEKCVVRFMYEGEVWGFTAAFGEPAAPSEFPLIQIHWPREVARIQVRKHERVPIQIPCTLHLEDDSTEACTICDISGGGCSLIASCDIAVSATVHLSFRMPDGGQVSRRPIIIRNRRSDPSGANCYGCQFQEEKEEDRGIELFVARKKAMDRGEAAPHPQLLVLSRNDEDVQIAQQALSESPYQAVAATGILDLGYRLHTCNAVGILICDEQKELSAIEIFPLIQQSQGMEEIPLFLYGGGAGMHDQAMSMGASMCLEHLSNAQDIFPHLPEIESPPTPDEAPDDKSAEESLSSEPEDNDASSEESEVAPDMNGEEDGDDVSDDDDDDDDDDDEINLG